MPEFEVNQPIPFEESWIENVHVNLRGLEASVKLIVSSCQVTSDVNKVAFALKALTLTDLTTLAGDDCTSNVDRLCIRACYPFYKHSITNDSNEFLKKLHVAAVCVYPTKVKDAYETLKRLNMLDEIQIASVATGFPTGLYPLQSRLDEITYAINSGATEIDIVIDRSLVLTHQWKKLYEEVVEMRKACGNRAHLKAILGIGECGTMDNVYKASMICMMGGADFIKTSTGKESVNANLNVGLCMIRAIQEFNRQTGKKIGLKPAGGVRTVDDSIQWLIMVKETLGMEYLNPHLFRFGASGLLDDIEKFVLSKC
ncbi:deoxyribose-phosphate aldolase [Chironomus tepperi]|uniref:deoxyribose-phosphate aldolase n=1 Tax=Chironomus tepperi TaxID=113505 RepID=UPI00391F323F